MRDHNRLIEQRGVAYVELLAAEYGCLYRKIAEHDKGIDGELELTEITQVQSPIIGIQVKARSEFYITSSNEISITVTEQNLQYWRQFGRPVILMAYSPSEPTVYWQRVDNATSKNIKVSLDSKFDKEAIQKFIVIINDYYRQLVRSIEVKSISEVLKEISEGFAGLIDPIEAKLLLAEEHIANEEYVLAENIYRALYVIYDEVPSICFNYCGCLLNSGKHIDATEIAYSIVAKFPNRWESYYYYGVCLEATGKPFQAKKEFLKSLKINPISAPVLGFLGLLHYRLGSYEIAKDDLFLAIQYKPNSYEWNYFNLALCHEALEEFDEALEKYNKAIDLNTLFWDAYYNKGLLLRGMLHVHDALECMNRAIEINPKDYRAYYMSGSILKDLGYNERAIQRYEIGLSMANDEPIFHSDLGCLYCRVGRLELAKYHFGVFAEKSLISDTMRIMDLGYKVAFIIDFAFDGNAIYILAIQELSWSSEFQSFMEIASTLNRPIEGNLTLHRQKFEAFKKDYIEGITENKS